MGLFPLATVVALLVLLALSCFTFVHGEIPTTLEGPFKPVTVPFNTSLRRTAIDLPNSDPRVQRTVNFFEPEQISVSLSTTHDSVWISWITGEYQIGDDIKPLDPESVASIVVYGKYQSPMTNQSTGYSVVYNQFYELEGLQNYTSGIIHHVRLTGLIPNTLYQYQCGDPSIPAMSEVSYFQTMPVSGPDSYPSRIGVIGDLGLTVNSTETVDQLLINHPQLLLLVGDLSYANWYLTNGTATSDCIHNQTYQPRWDFWGRYMQTLVSKVPLMVIEGDHEIEQQAGNQTFAAYSSRFAFPSEESGSSSSLFYSFNAGGIHFLMLGAYTSYEKSGDQYKWLEKDLANVDRNVTPWLVAAWHPPWYSTYTAHYREAECMRLELEDILYENGVDVVFNGHVHAYERSNRVYNYTLDPCGPVYITVGDGGNREVLEITHADEAGNCPEPSTMPGENKCCAFNFTSGFCWDQQPEYSAFRESSFGHGILEVRNETHALWTWHRNQEEYTSSSNTGDLIYIVRQPDKCPAKAKGSLNLTPAGSMQQVNMKN